MGDTSEYSWRIITTETEFKDLREEWEQLFVANPNHSPFMAWGWIWAWLRHLAGPHRIRMLVLADADGKLQIALPTIETNLSSISKTPEMAIACGYGRDCSDHLGILRLPRHDTRLIDLVSEGIQSRFGMNTRFRLDSLGSGNEHPEALGRSLKAAGYPIRVSNQNVCPSVKLPSDFDDFLKQLSRNFRSQVRRQFKRVDKSDEVRIRSVDSSSSIHFVKRLIELNQARMRELGARSSTEDDNFASFLFEAIPYMADSQLARMDVIEFSGQIAGAVLNLVHGQTVYFYMGGFDKSIAKLGPGNSMFMHNIKRGIAEGFTRYDFLRGSEPYKYRWGATDSPIQRLDIYPVGFLRGSLRCAVDDTIERLRSVVKQVRHRKK